MLDVSGPGFVNALAGLGNAKTNCWPMVLISGSSEAEDVGMGSFQEFQQVEAALPFTKWSVRVTNLQSIPRVVQRAVRVSLASPPGPVYIDFPADLLRSTTETPPKSLRLACKPAPVYPDPGLVQKAAELIKQAKNPLVIIGKGTGDSEASVRKFIDTTQLPFIATPMGKGVVRDTLNLNVSAGRSAALKNADLIILLGARLNWILHYGLPPRFSPYLKVVNVNLDPLELHNNLTAEVGLCSDLSATTEELVKHLGTWKCPQNTPWWSLLKSAMNKNLQASQKMLEDPNFNYYHAITAIKKHISEDAILVSEGANTMDIARTVVPSFKSKARIDAGSFGTMGVAVPACITSSLVSGSQVVGILGDSSFGFSAMEIETATRYNLDFIVFVINNNGVMMGTPKIPENIREIMPNWLNPSTDYCKLGEALGAKGYLARNLKELEDLLPLVFGTKGVRVVNVLIDPNSGKKPQENFWLSRASPKL